MAVTYQPLQGELQQSSERTRSIPGAEGLKLSRPPKGYGFGDLTPAPISLGHGAQRCSYLPLMPPPAE